MRKDIGYNAYVSVFMLPQNYNKLFGSATLSEESL